MRHRSRNVENATVSRQVELSVEEIVDVLAGGATRPLGPGQAVTQLEHALQTAALLAREHPGDAELAVAGLVHDLGQLLPGARDETHADEGAAAVRAALGERAAGIVALHVEAKRYLVTTDVNYKERLAGDSVVSLGRQGGAFTPGEAAAFLAQPWASDAVTLRRADDGAKAEGLQVGDLGEWVPILRQLSLRGAAPRENWGN
jgi:predicted HD phosphohydrolase